MDTLEWSPIWRRDAELTQPLAPRQARLCLAHLDDVSLEDIDPCSWPDDERDRAARMGHGLQRQRFLVSRLLLREQLAAQMRQAPQSLSIQILPHGKPTLRDFSEPQFNLAHTGAFWLLGLIADEGFGVGVDLERVRPLANMIRLAQRVFSPAEQVDLANAEPAEQYTRFFRGWTRKEAALKALGTGFSQSAAALHIGLDDTAEASCTLANGQTLFIYSGMTPDELFWAMATPSPLSSIQGFRLSWNELSPHGETLSLSKS